MLSSMPCVAKMDTCDGGKMGIIEMLCTCALCDIKVKGSKVGAWGTEGGRCSTS